MASRLEEKMAFAITYLCLPTPEREYRFIQTRRFRADFAWPDRKVLLEVEGGTWNGGRHTSGKGFASDCEKYNLAALEGWLVLRVTGAHIKSGEAVEWLKQALRLPFE